LFFFNILFYTILYLKTVLFFLKEKIYYQIKI